MIGAIGASSWVPLASIRREPIQPIRSNPVFEVPPVRAIRDQDPAFTGYGANGQSGAGGVAGRLVDRSV
jgi:hypothetical protein